MAAAKIKPPAGCMTRKDNVKTISGLKDSQFEWIDLLKDEIADKKSPYGLILIYEDW
ncbi:hypothetical protein AAC40_001393 [Salmonella enterica subsp. enterica]|nr:hypothetical protein [Salmonella enterica subsp. enterica]